MEDDESLARRLAAEDGLDVEALKALEQRWKPGQSSKLKKPIPEVIEVDSSDGSSINDGNSDLSQYSLHEPLPHETHILLARDHGCWVPE